MIESFSNPDRTKITGVLEVDALVLAIVDETQPGIVQGQVRMVLSDSAYSLSVWDGEKWNTVGATVTPASIDVQPATSTKSGG